MSKTVTITCNFCGADITTWDVSSTSRTRLVLTLEDRSLSPKTADRYISHFCGAKCLKTHLLRDDVNL